MSILSLFNRRNDNVKNSTDSLSLGSYFAQYINSGMNDSNAKKLFAVYACVNVLGESIATLPLHLYRTNKDGTREKVYNDFTKLINAPNGEDSKFDFLERMVWHLALRGNFYALKNKVGKDTRQLLWLEPDAVNTAVTDWVPAFTYKNETYSKNQIFFIKSHGGKSIISAQADTLAFASSLKEYSSSFFKNGARLSGMIEMPSKMDEVAFKRFKAMWNETFSGSQNAGKTAILDNGKTFHPLSVSNIDAQYLETTKKTDAEICGLFRVPPHMIGILDNATFSNIENQALQFSKYTLSPWCVRIEDAFTQQIIKPQYGDSYYCKFNMDALERGNIASRYHAYNIGRNAGFLSRNEVREKENYNPIEGGDDYLTPKNMGILGEEEKEETNEK